MNTMPTTNPWETLLSNRTTNQPVNQMAALNDLNVIQNFPAYKNNNIHLNLWPEPFMGNPDADIYLLSGNPGCANYNLESQFAQDQTFSNAMAQNLQHKFPIQGGDFVYLNTNIQNLKINRQNHSGCTWWERRTKTFRGKSTKTFFNIDFFPYHSEDLEGIPVNVNLSSYQYSNDLIQQAMNDGKIIIIMRLRNAWLKRIPDLKKYDKCYMLINPQSIYLTPYNIISYQDYLSDTNKAWNSII